MRKYIDYFMCVITVILLSMIFMMPSTVPIHYNINGEVDGYGSRYVYLIFALLPIGIYYGMLLDKRIDPKKKNRENQEIFDLFRYLLSFFFIVFAVYAYYCVFNDCFIHIGVFIGVLFILLGNYFPKIPQNYTLGIKLPWTLENEIVWNKTHRFGGYLFVIGGIFIIVASFINNIITFIMIIGFTISISILVALYSYHLYKKQE